MSSDTYQVKRTSVAPALDFQWDSQIWQQAETLTLEQVAPESKGFIPNVQVRLLHDGNCVYGIYKVEDKSVLCAVTEYNGCVCKDSCLEFFFRPGCDKGPYINLEMSASGARLNYLVKDWQRQPGGFTDYVVIPPEDGLKMEVKSSITEPVPVEKEGDITYYIQFTVPMEILEKYCGVNGDLGGAVWSGNFYKCCDAVKTPHWLQWQAVRPLNFHQPEFFGKLVFEA